jgi:hypothetical protein
MTHRGWRPLSAADPPPRCWPAGATGWFRYPMVSEHLGTPVGANKLRQLRSSSLRGRETASDQFAEKLAEFLPPAACVCFMPSSTRPSVESNPAAFPSLVLRRLRTLRPDVAVSEPLLRTAPVPCVHETRIHDVELLRSTLEPSGRNLSAAELHVVDDMIGDGATYAAFSAALRDHWPELRAILLALVFAPRRPKVFE